MSKQIAFLGLGLMGAPMTANLARKGFSVKAWNRSRDRPGIKIASDAGAAIALSLQDAVAEADVILTCLGDVPDVEEVILGGVAKLAKSGTIVVDMSTIGSKAAQHIATELQKHNIRFLDAPVSGGDIGAQQGTLTIMVGGDEADFEECKPLFAAMGKIIRHCGPVGSGQAVKMCNQILCSLHMIGLCEAIKMAQLQGIDPHLMIEVCSTGAAGSWALANLGTKIVADDLAPGFAIKHILKDLRLVTEALELAGEDLQGVLLAEKLFKMVKELDNGKGAELGTQGMIRCYQ